MSSKIIFISTLMLLAVVVIFLIIPSTANAQTGISVGYTGIHDGTRGRVLMFDYELSGTHWDFTAGNISNTQNRDTSFIAASYEIDNKDLYASFGPALITRQTETLTSTYQFMTTFGYHHAGDAWSIGVRHISNGGLRGSNIGENMVFVSWNL